MNSSPPGTRNQSHSSGPRRWIPSSRSSHAADKLWNRLSLAALCRSRGKGRNDWSGYLLDTTLARLEHRDQFQGAMHELFAEATCLHAGFTIIRENEKDPNRRHVEFTAVHKSTGQHVLVEAKSRHRAGVMGQPGARDASADIKFRRLINDAVTKDPNNPLVIFVDTNLPPRSEERRV